MVVIMPSMAAVAAGHFRMGGAACLPAGARALLTADIDENFHHHPRSQQTVTLCERDSNR